jgi:hypothetical protein
VAGLAAVAAGNSPLHGLDGSFAGFLGLSLQLMLALVLSLLAIKFDAWFAWITIAALVLWSTAEAAES